MNWGAFPTKRINNVVYDMPAMLAELGFTPGWTLVAMSILNRQADENNDNIRKIVGAYASLARSSGLSDDIIGKLHKFDKFQALFDPRRDRTTITYNVKECRDFFKKWKPAQPVQSDEPDKNRQATSSDYAATETSSSESTVEPEKVATMPTSGTTNPFMKKPRKAGAYINSEEELIRGASQATKEFVTAFYWYNPQPEAEPEPALWYAKSPRSDALFHKVDEILIELNKLQINYPKDQRLGSAHVFKILSWLSDESLTKTVDWAFGDETRWGMCLSLWSKLGCNSDKLVTLNRYVTTMLNVFTEDAEGFGPFYKPYDANVGIKKIISLDRDYVDNVKGANPDYDTKLATDAATLVWLYAWYEKCSRIEASNKSEPDDEYFTDWCIAKRDNLRKWAQSWTQPKNNISNLKWVLLEKEDPTLPLRRKVPVQAPIASKGNGNGNGGAIHFPALRAFIRLTDECEIIGGISYGFALTEAQIAAGITVEQITWIKGHEFRVKGDPSTYVGFYHFCCHPDRVEGRDDSALATDENLEMFRFDWHDVALRTQPRNILANQFDARLNLPAN